MLLVPGNHDYGYRGSFLLRERRFELFKKWFYGPDFERFPIPTRLGGHLLLGVNSMEGIWSNKDTSFFANGRAGGTQRERLVRQIKDYREKGGNGRVIVYLHHHPFLYPDAAPEDSLILDAVYGVHEDWFHEMEDGKPFLADIKGKVDVLLFGHERRNLNFTGTELCGPKGYGIPYICSMGKSTEKGQTLSPSSPLVYEFTEYGVNKEGKAVLNKPLKEGLLGRLITIEDDRAALIQIETIVFAPKACGVKTAISRALPEGGEAKAAPCPEPAPPVAAIGPGGLKPGDVFLYKYTETSGWLPMLITTFDGGPYYHAAVFDGKNVAEAIGEGLISRPLPHTLADITGQGVKVDVFRFAGKSGVELGGLGFEAAPVLENISAYVAQGERYGHEQLVLLALLTLCRKPPYNALLPGLAGIVREILDSSAGILAKMMTAGKEPMICSEFVYRCFAEAGDGRYKPAINNDRDSAVLGACFSGARSISPVELDQIKKEGASFLAQYQTARHNTNPDFVTPRDLFTSPNLKLKGRLTP